MQSEWPLRKRFGARRLLPFHPRRLTPCEIKKKITLTFPGQTPPPAYGSSYPVLAAGDGIAGAVSALRPNEQDEINKRFRIHNHDVVPFISEPILYVKAAGRELALRHGPAGGDGE